MISIMFHIQMITTLEFKNLAQQEPLFSSSETPQITAFVLQLVRQSLED